MVLLLQIMQSHSVEKGPVLSPVRIHDYCRGIRCDALLTLLCLGKAGC